MGRGAIESPPPVFSDCRKGRRVAPRFLTHLFTHLWRICCENFRPRSLNVKSPGHVKWPYLTKSLNVPHSFTDWTIAVHLSVIDTRTSICKIVISKFLSWLPKDRSTLWRLHYKSTGENWKAPLLDENHFKHSQTSGYSWFDTLNQKTDTSDLSSYSRGHFR